MSGRSVGERLATLEAEMKHLATKSDISRLASKLESNILRLEKILQGGIKIVVGVLTLGLTAAALIAKFL